MIEGLSRTRVIPAHNRLAVHTAGQYGRFWKQQTPATLSHTSAGGLDFTDFIDLQLTDLTANEAIVIQGMEFSVFPSDSMGMLGDVDLNGVVDFFDIAPFIDLLSSQTFQFEADIDGNMVVNFFDIAPFIAILSGQ